MANEGSADGAGCFESAGKRGPCMRPPPILSPRAEEIWHLFGESMASIVGMSVGLAPNRTFAVTLAEACGIKADAEFWFLFGDLERAWVELMNQKTSEE